MAKYTFGEIQGIQEGDYFENRQALRAAGIHLATQAGIDGNKQVGAPSIILNGGYVDDYDNGNEVLYTGHGGNDPNSKRQTSNQSWEARGNKALIVSEMHGLPVRVTRGAEHKSPYSPKNGYKYGGLFTVVDHFEEVGKDGFLICRYRLVKQPAENNMQLEDEQGAYNTLVEPAKRVPATVLRIVRDTKISRFIKEMYEYKCQVCDTRIDVLGVGYAEAAHIKPLGSPHNGSDSGDNVICLCPNHHVMLDKGAFSFDDDFNCIGIPGKLVVKDAHKILPANLSYHRERIFINK